MKKWGRVDFEHIVRSKRPETGMFFREEFGNVLDLWCEEQAFKGRWRVLDGYDICVGFDDQNDAMLFKLSFDPEILAES